MLDRCWCVLDVLPRLRYSPLGISKYMHASIYIYICNPVNMNQVIVVIAVCSVSIDH